MTETAPRIVIDTNAWLDLLLFDDHRATALRQALYAGTVHAVGNAACRDEWLRVLQYPQLALDRTRRAAMLLAFDALARPLPDDAPVREPATLPRCRDRDDQQFVQLAFDAHARWLVSRDREVLALGRRTARAGWFDIVTPQDWTPATIASSG
ncbi:MAG: putative toxin-antitoxin system toxin component, PIN family [Lysobacter sp.]|nr:putative toxin-antitoxin system toxin component, PIN family [Lysobacter sp.]